MTMGLYLSIKLAQTWVLGSYSCHCWLYLGGAEEWAPGCWFQISWTDLIRFV